ncbi:MAG: HEPN domain-containing protein [Blastocatellia bacterium]
MKAITREWIVKAEGEWNAAGLLFRARKHPNYDAACFHAQQCIQEYLKARIEEAGAFGKTVDRKKLLDLALSTEPGWNLMRHDIVFLSDFTVEYLYPGRSATKQQAKEAVKRCGAARWVIRKAFGLKP